MTKTSAGKRFRLALESNHPLQIVGTINAYCAMQAEKAGHQAIYLSGGGVANASYGLPDLGITSLNDVIADVERITNASQLPLLVDIDTGWGGAFNIARTITAMEKAGAAAVHIEDQVSQKRCGHRPNKSIVSQAEMVDRIKAAILEIEQYQKFANALDVPILANITEFGKTPLFNCETLGKAGVAMVLYPLSAFRAMSKAAEEVYQAIATHGDQMSVVPGMQTREQLYEVLGYHAYEQKLDELFEN